MHRSLFALVGIAAACGACSPSVDNGSTTAGSGGGGTSSTTATTGTASASSSAATTGSGGGATTGSGGGGGGAAPCPDASNPLFGSCVVAFLAGCFAPDLAGTCTDMNGVVAWSDGSKYVTEGAMAGLYGPGDAAPCIAITSGDDSITAKKGDATLVFLTDPATQTATITCPDGSTLMATDDQVTAFNRCVGINCP